MTKEMEKYRDVAMKSLAVLGLMTILALGSFVILTALTYIPKVVSYISQRTMEATSSMGSATHTGSALSLSLDKTSVSSGSSITLNFKNQGTDAGSYSLSFPCLSGVTVKQAGTTIPCNIPFNLGPDDSSLTLTVYSKKTPSKDLPFPLRFPKNGEGKTSLSD